MALKNFRSASNILEEDFYYHYVFNVIKLSKNMMETLYEEDIYRDHLLKIKKTREIVRYKDYTLIKTLEFVGAPPKYLKEHHYSELDINDYLEEIKQSRKHVSKKGISKSKRVR